MTRKVLIVGGGAREHVICSKLKQDGQNGVELFCAPGNGGISQIAECFPVRADNLAGLLALAKEIKPDLTVVGPEAPLAAGIVDLFSANRFAIVGPSKAAARLETSKIFAKEFMWRHKIPTAKAVFFNDANDASVLIQGLKNPPVIKADGLCGGKGVVVANNTEEALKAVDEIMVQRKFGDAGNWVIVEERLVGVECSLIVLTDGLNVIPFKPARDFKRRFDGDKGPNTGGMGCYAPVPEFTPEIEDEVMESIVMPTIRGMADEETLYRGFLYFGLMLTEKGPKVLEDNARMGDPEASVILPMLCSDFYELLLAGAQGGLNGVKAKWSNSKAVCVVITANPYPDKASTGEIIAGLEQAERCASVFHAGTAKMKTGEILTAGGRVLDIVGAGNDFRHAREAAYRAVSYINFPGMDYRKDIGAKLINW